MGLPFADGGHIKKINAPKSLELIMLEKPNHRR